jgi:hypothetical protein
MLTGFVLANVTAGALPLLLAPLPFRVLLDVRYPPKTKKVHPEERTVAASNESPHASSHHLETVRSRPTRVMTRSRGNSPRLTRQPSSRRTPELQRGSENGLVLREIPS